MNVYKKKYNKKNYHKYYYNEILYINYKNIYSKWVKSKILVEVLATFFKKESVFNMQEILELMDVINFISLIEISVYVSFIKDNIKKEEYISSIFSILYSVQSARFEANACAESISVLVDLYIKRNQNIKIKNIILKIREEKIYK